MDEALILDHFALVMRVLKSPSELEIIIMNF